MRIVLTRPLVALDVETHDKVGTDLARIVELGFHILYPDNRPPKKYVTFVNPEVPISTEVSELHGILDSDVAAAPTFKQLAANLAHGFSNCDFCGYNVKFDLAIIKKEMDRASVRWSYEDAYLLDGLRLWQVVKPRSLSHAVQEWLKREPSEAHRALGDATDALEVATALVDQFDLLPNTVKELHELCFPKDRNSLDAAGKLVWLAEKPAITFGKHRGKTLDNVPKDYLEWMVGSDFPDDVKLIIKSTLEGNMPTKKKAGVQS